MDEKRIALEVILDFANDILQDYEDEWKDTKLTNVGNVYELVKRDGDRMHPIFVIDNYVTKISKFKDKDEVFDIWVNQSNWIITNIINELERQKNCDCDDFKYTEYIKY